MINAKIIDIEDSIRVIPNDGYSIRMVDDDGNYSYADGFVQFPPIMYDENKIDTISTKDIPPIVIVEEIDYEKAYNELVEVIENG